MSCVDILKKNRDSYASMSVFYKSRIKYRYSWIKYSETFKKSLYQNHASYINLKPKLTPPIYLSRLLQRRSNFVFQGMIIYIRRLSFISMDILYSLTKRNLEEKA